MALLNTQKNGLYASIQPVIVHGAVVPGFVSSPQQIIVGNADCTCEGHAIDTTETIHPASIPAPNAPGAIIGTTHGPAQVVSDYSKIMQVNGKCVLTSATKKYLNTGNCPIAPMVSATANQGVYNVSNGGNANSSGARFAKLSGCV